MLASDMNPIRNSIEQAKEPIPFKSDLLNGHFNGGIPRGRLVEIAGAPGVGKSCLATDLVAGAVAQSSDSIVLYLR